MLQYSNMDLTSAKTIKNLLQTRQIKPSRSLGQNFLVDKEAFGKVIETADIRPDEIVLEIGPGLGVLTQELAKRAKRVVAVEKDAKMCGILSELLKCWNVINVDIVNADILKYKTRDTRYKVVGNLPFYITAPVIRKFLESESPPKEMILMVQKEVAQKICAKVPDMNLLAISVQFYAEPQIISYVSKKSFWPSPEVDAAIIKITPGEPQTSDVATFFRIVKAGFSQPRKQLINNLSKSLKLDKIKVRGWLLENSIQPTQRAETLNMEDWLKLTKNFSKQ